MPRQVGATCLIGPARDRGARASVPAAILLAAAALAWGETDPRFEDHAIASVPRGVEVERGIAFAPDGSQVAFVGSRDGKSVPVIGSSVFEAYWYVGAPRFGAGGRVAFSAAKEPGKRVHMCWALLDGKKAPETVGISEWAWSPDGRRLAFVAMPECRIAEDKSREGDCFLVIDGRRSAKQRGVSQPTWSRDSGHVLAVAETAQGKYAVLLDNRTYVDGGRYDGPVFSGDGSRIAYASELVRNGALALDPVAIKWFVACGDLRLGLDFDSAGSPVFSPDARRIASKAERAGRVGISVDGAAPAGDWAFVTTPVFSPDGSRMAFTASDDCTVFPGTRVTRLGEEVVSGGSWRLVLDGKASEEKFAALRDLTFSPDARRLAYRARSGSKWRVVCGETRSEEFEFAGPPLFSPDSARLAFGVLSGRDFAWKVLAVGK